ncbi:MAG: tRNA-(ms[2]io[6]A)-hydroxylase [Chlamydiales bacterium]|jgi:tRNA-(ms[2]io[6]A)-hydroxylase
MTPPEWVERVAVDPIALLSDHAHCELKAAASAQALIAKNPGRTNMLRDLSAVAQEEMEHFTRVVDLLVERGGTLGKQLKSPYADGLLKQARRMSVDPLLERLLTAALIEARSLERFHLLATGLRDEGLAQLYRDLLPSEAAHQGLFLRLAREAFPAEIVAEAHGRLRRLEAEVASALPFAYQVHSGLAESVDGASA